MHFFSEKKVQLSSIQYASHAKRGYNKLKSQSDYKKLVNRNSRNATEKSCGYFEKGVIDIAKII